MLLDRKYVIAACLAVFVSWALITDWFPTLRWIPYAFAAGVCSSFAAFAYVLLTTSGGASNGEYVERRRLPLAPAFTSPGAWEEQKAVLNSRVEYRRPLIFPEAVTFSKAADQLLDLIIRDYVTAWYSSISKRPLFQHEIDRCIRSVLLTLAARLTNFDLVELGVAKLLPLVTSHLKEFYDAERLVRGKDLSYNLTESDELDTAIASKYKNGNLHVVASFGQADTSDAQQRHTRGWIAKLLPVLLPDNMKSSLAVLILVRELVTCAVLGPVSQLLIDPDTWNQLIVTFGGPMLQDRKAVRKVRAALDQNAPVSPAPTRTSQFPRLRPYDNERQFERFIRAIRQVSTLPDARRFRNEITSQLRRDTAVDGQDPTYLRRLETGKRLLDQKISSLSTEARKKSNIHQPVLASADTTTARKKQASLREVLYDASGLSYFMEFMDRLKLTCLVQFFIVVDGFRGPLEGDMDEIDLSAADDPERMDIGQMYEGYLNKTELHAKPEAIEAVRRYLKAGANATRLEYANARRAVLRTQSQVYHTMAEIHFGSFKKSDLYYKWLAIDVNPDFTSVQSNQTGPVHDLDGPAKNETGPTRKRLQPTGEKAPELRRAVLSSTNLQDVAKHMADNERRSLDDNTSRPALFNDDVDDARMSRSLTSLHDEGSDHDAAEQAKDKAEAVSAMQLALDDIVGEEDKDSLFSESNGRQSLEITEGHPSSGKAPLERPSLDNNRPEPALRASDRGKPSIASLGLVGGPSNRGVFVDDLFAEESHKFAEDEREDSDGQTQSDEEQVQEAAPGDLGLAEAIDSLNLEIERLTAQKQIVDSLMSKAELTNNTAELRILQKSEQSLLREIRRKEMQKQQYAVQESDNNLYGRADVSIKSVMIGREDDGHEFALYVIEVNKQAGEQLTAASWAVTRRYSQFHELHKRLRSRFPSVRELDFPRRQALFTLQKDFVEKRRGTLERYLKSLLLEPAICRSREFRAFLSQSTIISNGTEDGQVDAKDFVTRIYNSVSDGMEEFLGNIPVLDQLSVAGQNLITAATSQMSGASAPFDNLYSTAQGANTAAEAQAELTAYEVKDIEPFVKPICDLFLETFELSKGNSWLRGRTVVIVLHQLLGGTVERKVREAAKSAMGDESMAHYVDLLKAAMWPDGKLRKTRAQRTEADRARTRKEASLIFDALIPDVVGSVVGRGNAKAAGRKVIALLNNQRLNTHIVFALIDELLRLIFPELTQK